MTTAAEQKPPKRGLLGALFGGRSAPKRANLGDENQFYYNEKLKRWVERGSEHLHEEDGAAPPPPPKSFTSSRPPSTSSITSAAEGGEELNIPGHSRRNSTESADEQVVASINGFPKSRSQKSLYGRYVDVGFGNNQPPKGGSAAPRKDLLPAPLSTSAPASNVKFFVPQPATPTTPAGGGYQVSADSSSNGIMRHSENGSTSDRHYFTSSDGTEMRPSENGSALDRHEIPSNYPSNDGTEQNPAETSSVSADAADLKSPAVPEVSNSDLASRSAQEVAPTDATVNDIHNEGSAGSNSGFASHPIHEPAANDAFEDDVSNVSQLPPPAIDVAEAEPMESATCPDATVEGVAGDAACTSAEPSAVAMEATTDGSGYDWSQWANFDWTQWGPYEDWTEEQQQWYQCYQQWYMWYYQSQGVVEGTEQSADGAWAEQQQQEELHPTEQPPDPMDSQPAPAEVMELTAVETNLPDSRPGAQAHSVEPSLQIVKSLTEEWLHGSLGINSPEPLPPPAAPHHFPSPQTDSDLSLPNTPIQQPTVQSNPLFSGDLKLRNRLDWESDEDDSSQHSPGASPKSMGINYSQLSPLSKEGRGLGGLANHALSAAGQLAGGLLSTAASQLSKDNTSGVLSWLNPGQEAEEAASSDVNLKYELRARRFLEDKDGMALTDSLLFDGGSLGDDGMPAAAAADAESAKDSPPLADDQLSTSGIEPVQDDSVAGEDAQMLSGANLPAIDTQPIFPATPASPVETPSISPSPQADSFLETPSDASPYPSEATPPTTASHTEPGSAQPPSPTPTRQHPPSDHHMAQPDPHPAGSIFHQTPKQPPQPPLTGESSSLSGDSNESDATGFAIAAAEDEDDTSTSLPFSSSQRTTMDGSLFGEDAPANHNTPSSPAHPTPESHVYDAHAHFYHPSPSTLPRHPDPSASLPPHPQQAAAALISQLHSQLNGIMPGDALTTLSMLAEQVALINSTQPQHPDPSLPSTSSSPPTLPNLHDAKVLSLVQYHQHATLLQTRQNELAEAQQQLRHDAELLLTLPVDAQPAQAAEVAAVRTRVHGIASHPLQDDAHEQPDHELHAVGGFVEHPRSDSPAAPPTPGSSMDLGARKPARDETPIRPSSAPSSAAADVATAAVVASQQLEQLHGDNVQLREDVHALQGENEQAQEQIRSLQGENGQLREEVSVLQASLSQTQGALVQEQSISSQLRAENTQLRTENGELCEQNEKLMEENGQLVGEAAQLREENSVLTGERTQLQGETTNLRANLEHAQGRLAQQEQEGEQLRLENASLSGSLTEAQSSLAAAQERNANLQSEYEQLQGDHEDLLVALAAESEKVEAVYGIALHHGATAEELDARIDGIEENMMNDGAEGEAEAEGQLAADADAAEEEEEQAAWEV